MSLRCLTLLKQSNLQKAGDCYMKVAKYGNLGTIILSTILLVLPVGPSGT